MPAEQVDAAEAQLVHVQAVPWLCLLLKLDVRHFPCNAKEKERRNTSESMQVWSALDTLKMLSEAVLLYMLQASGSVSRLKGCVNTARLYETIVRA